MLFEGIITDLEGDGILDYVTADVAFAQLRIHNNDENPQTILKFTIRKFTLQNIYQKLPSVSRNLNFIQFFLYLYILYFHSNQTIVNF